MYVLQEALAFIEIFNPFNLFRAGGGRGVGFHPSATLSFNFPKIGQWNNLYAHVLKPFSPLRLLSLKEFSKFDLY